MLSKLISLALVCSIGLVNAAPLEQRDLPTNYNGKFIITVQGSAVDGKADELQKLISAVRAHSNDPHLEPNTLTYRVARGFDDERNDFTIIEEYTNQAAWDFHKSTQVYQDLINSGAIGSLTQSFSQEFF